MHFFCAGVLVVCCSFAACRAGQNPVSPLARLNPQTIPEDERGPDLPEELVAVLGTERGRHWQGMGAIAISPDAKTIATGGYDSLVCLWDAKTLRRLGTLRGHEGMVLQVAFAADGATLASSGTDRTVRLWDLKAIPPQQRVILPHGGQTGVWSIAFSPDGKTLASGTFDVRLWDLSQEKPAERARMEMESGVSALTFSRDSKTLVAACRGQVVLWDLGPREPVKRGTINGGVYTSAVLSPDERVLACGSLHPEVELWDVSGKVPQKTNSFRIDPKPAPEKPSPFEMEERVSSLTFTPDGKALILGSEHGEIQLWDLGAAKPAKRPLSPPLAGSYVTISADGKTLAACTYDGTIRAWTLGDDKISERAPTAERRRAGECLSFSPDGKMAACGTQDGTVRLWDLTNEQPRERPVLRGHAGPVAGVAFSPDGTRLASASLDGKAFLWDIRETQGQKKAVLHHKNSVNSVAFAPDGNSLVTASRDVELWDLTESQPKVQTVLKLDGSPNNVVSVCFAADGKTLAACGWNGVAMVWKVIGQKVTKLAAIEIHSSLMSAALTPNGKELALGCANGSTYLWDLVPAIPVERTTLEVKRPVTSVTYSLHDSLLAFASENGEVILCKEGAKIHSWKMPGEVFAVQFAPDSRHLAMVNSNGTAHLLRLPEDLSKLKAAQQPKKPVDPFADGRRKLSEVEAFISKYHAAPEPERIGSFLDLVLSDEVERQPLLQDPRTINLIGHSFGHMARGKSDLVRLLESRIPSASPTGRKLLLTSLRVAGNKETVRLLEGCLKDKKFAKEKDVLADTHQFLNNPQRKLPRDLPAQTPHDLDLLWADFLVTGEYVPVARILDVLDLPGKESNPLQTVAAWSLETNVQQHKKLAAILRDRRTQRTGISRQLLDSLFEPERKDTRKE